MSPGRERTRPPSEAVPAGVLYRDRLRLRMGTLRRRVVGFTALILAAVSLLLAVGATPSTPVAAAGATALPPRSPLAAPALCAVGSVLLVGGAAAAVDGDLSARAALLAPFVGVVSAVASGVVGTGAVPDTATVVVAGATGAVAAGAVVGSAVAPTVRASTTGDTAALLVGAVLLLASIAVASDAAPSLAAGGLGGTVGVAALWLADAEAWQP